MSFAVHHRSPSSGRTSNVLPLLSLGSPSSPEKTSKAFRIGPIFRHYLSTQILRRYLTRRRLFILLLLVLFIWKAIEQNGWVTHDRLNDPLIAPVSSASVEPWEPRDRVVVGLVEALETRRKNEQHEHTMERVREAKKRLLKVVDKAPDPSQVVAEEEETVRNSGRPDSSEAVKGTGKQARRRGKGKGVKVAGGPQRRLK